MAELKLICYGCQELTKYWLCARNIPGIVNNHEKCIYFNLVLLSLLFRSTQFIQQGFSGASRPSSFTTFNFEFICEHFLFVQNIKKYKFEVFIIFLWGSTQNFGSAVLMFIGYKQSDKHTLYTFYWFVLASCICPVTPGFLIKDDDW